MPLQVSVNVRAVDIYLKRFKKLPKGALPLIRKVLKEHGRTTINAFKRERLSGGAGVGVVTGDLRRSFKSKVVGKASLRFFSDSPYASIHEHGGVITAKRGVMLKIPVSKEQQIQEGLSAQFQVVKDKEHNAFLVDKITGKIAYALKESVYVPPRLGFGKFIRSSIPRLKKILGEAFSVFLRTGRG